MSSGESTTPPVGVDEALLRRLIDLNPGYLWATDLDLRFLIVVGQALERRGIHTPEALIGQSLGSVVDDEVALDAHARALQGEAVDYVAMRGERVWSARVEPLRHPDGTVEGVVGIAVETTDVTQVEHELDVNRAKLELALSQLPAVFWAVDAQLRLTSAAGRPLAHRDVAGWIGRPLPELFGDESHPSVVAHEAALAGGTGTYELAIEGRDYDVRVDPLRNREGAIVGAVGLAVDVTDERDERLGAERLAALVEHSSDAIVGTGRDGRVFCWNPAAERLFGWTAAEMLGETTDRIVPEEERETRTASRHRVWAGEPSEELEATRVHKDGSPIHIWVMRSPIFDRRGEVSGFWTIVRDLAVRERAEAEEKLEAVAGLAAAVAHDFDDLLTAITGYADQLARELPAGESRKTLDSIMVASERAVKLAQGLLEFSRRQPAELPPLRFDPETLRQTLLDLAPSSAPRPAGEAQARAVGAPSGVRVLVVEDEQLVRQLVVQSLEVAGHVVTATASPNAAVELVRDGLELDLLLTDFVMPELYGDELVEKVRELRPGLPALVMSGYVNNPDLFPQRLAFLPKPFRPSELVAAVLRALAQS